MTFPLPELPTSLTVTVGEVGTIALPSYSGGGYAWSVTMPDGARTVEAQVETGPVPRPAAVPGAEPPPMTVAPEQLAVRGVSPGTVRCRLVLQRPFEPRPAAKHDITVEVVSR